MPIQLKMQQCTHIKLNGYRCGSPALVGQTWCFFHARTRRRAKAHLDAAIPSILLLEDANSIQGALMQVIDMLLVDQINVKKAQLIVRAIECARKNMKDLREERLQARSKDKDGIRFREEMVHNVGFDEQDQDEFVVDDPEPSGEDGEVSDEDASWLPDPIWCEPDPAPKKPPLGAESETEPSDAAVSQLSG